MTPADQNTLSAVAILGPQDVSGNRSGGNAVLGARPTHHAIPDFAYTVVASIPLECEEAPHGWDLFYAVDWFFSLFLFFVTLPVSALAALWVFAVDPGNPFYTQRRVGRDMRPYTIFKIRTMRHADHEARFCAKDDERIIPGGQFLRTTRIDELPQLANVILGDMALIGPRPEQLPFVREFLRTIPNYGRRFSVKPGITGLAQVTQGYVACEDGTREKLRLDLEFIQQRSLSLWFAIACKTLRVIITGHGAR